MDVKDMEQENSSNFDLPLEEIIAYNDLPTIRNETEETIAAIKEDGYDLNEFYGIRHMFACYNFNNLEKLAIELFNKFGSDLDLEGPVEEIDEDTNKPIYCFNAFTEHKLDVEEIMAEAEQIVALCNACAVMYDGWGSNVDDGEEELNDEQ